MKLAQNKKRCVLSVAAAQDEDVLLAVCDAASKGIVEPILVGNVTEIKELADKNNLDISGYEMISADELVDAARLAVELVSTGKADLL